MSLSKIFKKYPVLIQCFQSGSLMAAGDVISQFGVEQKKIYQFDWTRPARFFGIGFIVVAPALRVWYGFLDKKFGAIKYGAFRKVAVDQLIFAPSFLIVFLTTVGITQRHSLTDIQLQIKRDYSDIVLANWTIWPAVQVCNFSFVPLKHQVLVVQTFALFWNTYLAWKTNRQNVTVINSP